MSTMIDAAPTLTLPSTDRRTKLSSGQCNKYHEYEINPTKTTGRADRTIRLTALPREASSIALPETGTRAANPGNGVFASKQITAEKISSIPVIPRILFQRDVPESAALDLS